MGKSITHDWQKHCDVSLWKLLFLLMAKIYESPGGTNLKTRSSFWGTELDSSSSSSMPWCTQPASILRFNSARSTIDPLIDGVTPLPLSLPFHFPLLHKPHSLYCSFLTSIYSVLSPFLSASTWQMSEALWSPAGMFAWAGQCLSVPGFLWKVRAAAFSHRWHTGTKGPLS